MTSETKELQLITRNKHIITHLLFDTLCPPSIESSNTNTGIMESCINSNSPTQGIRYRDTLVCLFVCFAYFCCLFTYLLVCLFPFMSPCPHLCPLLPLSPSILVPIYVPFYPCPHLCPLVPIDTKGETDIACPQDPGKSEDYEISSTTLATVESIEELTEDNYEEDSSSFYNVNIHI